MLLFFNFGVWADNIYRDIIRSRPICLPKNDCLIYIIHQRRTAVCATQKPVLKSELMTTRYVENKDDDVAKRAALLPKRGGSKIFAGFARVIKLQNRYPGTYKNCYISPPLTGGCSEGLGALCFFFKQRQPGELKLLCLSFLPKPILLLLLRLLRRKTIFRRLSFSMPPPLLLIFTVIFDNFLLGLHQLLYYYY